MSNLNANMNLNVFNQSDLRGREDLPVSNNKIRAKLVLDDGVKLSAGDMIKLCGYTDENGGLPTATSVTNAQQRLDTEFYGFIPLSKIKNVYENGDIVTMCLETCVMIMQASQPFNCGDQVYYDNRDTAVAGSLFFKQANLTKLKLITAGTLDLSVDGTSQALTGLNFSAISSLSDVATVLNTKLSSVATVAYSNGAIVITSKTTGADSSVAMVSTSGDTFEALGDSIQIDGKVAGENNGRVIPYQGSAINGLIKCGVCLQNSLEENSLIKVYIK